MNAIVSDQPLPQVTTATQESSISRHANAALWESVVIAADSIWSHKLRSILTLLGIIIGVASVVTVGGAISGLGTYINERLVSTFGSNTFTLARIARMNISYEDWDKLNKRNKKLYPTDLQAVEERCDDCQAVVPRLRATDDAKVGSRTFYDASISGINQDLPKIQELGLEEGRFLSELDVDHARQYAVIGTDIRDELFGEIPVAGKEIKISGDTFSIVGVEQKNGTFFGQSLDNNIYIPYTVFLKKFGSRRSISIQVRAPSAESLESTQDEVRVIMRTRHHLRPGQEDDFDILGSKAIQESVAQFTGAIAVVVTPITLISLVVGGIVIMNIMLVTVTERTQEIGMRKAVGARRRDIMLQFLIESSLLAAIGGAIGILVAYGLGLIIRGTTPVPITITAGYIALAILASGGIGLISGIYPAHRAAKLDPIVALSRE
jgi:putative ABC transport system permease protein